MKSTTRKRQHEIITFLRNRELFGSCNTNNIFNKIPERLKVDYCNLNCKSDVLLGFNSVGTQIIGYSSIEKEEKTSVILIQSWELDFHLMKASKLIFSLELPSILELHSDALEEYLVPLSVVDVRSKTLIATRYCERSDLYFVIENYICIIDEEDVKFGTILKVRYSYEGKIEGLILPTAHHIGFQENNNQLIAFDLGNQIRIVQIGDEKFPLLCSSSHWWKRRDQDCDKLEELNFHSNFKSTNGNSQNCYFSCRTLDAEAYLIETLQKQLKAKLLIKKENNSIPSNGYFSILDYFIQFIRFLSSNDGSFEFVTMAKVQLFQEIILIVIIGQISSAGFRTAHLAKSKTINETISLQARCMKFVQTRRHGYDYHGAVILNNTPVILAQPIQKMQNPNLPFEIIFKPK